MNVPRQSEGGAAIATTFAAAPHHSNGGPAQGVGGSGETLMKKEEEEDTLGQLRDRLGLVPGLARVPGPRTVFVHIKVEDITSGEDTDAVGGGGVGKEATGEEVRGGEEGQQREQPAHTGGSFEACMAAGADAAAPRPRRARLPPRSYADTAVELDTGDGNEEEEKGEPELGGGGGGG